MASKQFLCKECKQPITKKSDQAVVGNLFITYHNDCFNAIKHKSAYAFYSGYKSNGWFPFVILVIFNVILWGAYKFLNTPFEEAFIFSIFTLVMTLFFRVMSYIFYERFFSFILKVFYFLKNTLNLRINYYNL